MSFCCGQRPATKRTHTHRTIHSQHVCTYIYEIYEQQHHSVLYIPHTRAKVLVRAPRIVLPIPLCSHCTRCSDACTHVQMCTSNKRALYRALYVQHLTHNEHAETLCEFYSMVSYFFKFSSTLSVRASLKVSVMGLCRRRLVCMRCVYVCLVALKEARVTAMRDPCNICRRHLCMVHDRVTMQVSMFKAMGQCH